MSTPSQNKYGHIDTFQELELEITRKQFELTLAEKQLEIATLEMRYQLDPRRLINSLWKKAIQYVLKLF
jgi:hypothetical protein